MPTQPAFQQKQRIPGIEQHAQRHCARRTPQYLERSPNQPDVEQIEKEREKPESKHICALIGTHKPAEEATDQYPDGTIGRNRAKPVIMQRERIMWKSRDRHKIGVGMISGQNPAVSSINQNIVRK